MDRVLDGIHHQCAMAFLNDVLVYSPTLEDHLVHVREVLECIMQAGLTINPDKVQLCTQSLTFLGHAISPGKCRPDPEKVRAVADYPQPSNIKQLATSIPGLHWLLQELYSTISALLGIHKIRNPL